MTTVDCSNHSFDRILLSPLRHMSYGKCTTCGFLSCLDARGNPVNPDRQNIIKDLECVSSNYDHDWEAVGRALTALGISEQCEGFTLAQCVNAIVEVSTGEKFARPTREVAE